MRESSGNTSGNAALPPITWRAFSHGCYKFGETLYFYNRLTGEKHVPVTWTGDVCIVSMNQDTLRRMRPEAGFWKMQELV